MTSRRAQIELRPEVLTWARERARISQEDLARKMQVKIERVIEWEETGTISAAQVDKLAKSTHAPLGHLYLSEPPREELPIPDFRTRRADSTSARPSPNLLDTVYAMQRRQEWMRDELIAQYEEPPLPFVGAFALEDDPAEVAEAMREALDITDEWAAAVPNWSAALRRLRDTLEDAGVLVVFNGVVGNNSHRKLDRDEFQGFALVDEYAPLIFVNNTDFKAAQMFTLAHELAHIFVGQTGVSRLEDMQPAANDTERFCDRTAAEFLVPEDELRDYWWNIAVERKRPHQSVARRFKVSSIVAARRALDLELIDRSDFMAFLGERRDEGTPASQQSKGGGNFWFNQVWRIGPRFASTVFRAVKEGRLAYTQAYSLTGLRGHTFENMAGELGLDL